MTKPSPKASRRKKRRRKSTRSGKAELSGSNYSGGALQGMTDGMQSLFRKSPKGGRRARRWLIDLTTITLVAGTVAVLMWRCQ